MTDTTKKSKTRKHVWTCIAEDGCSFMIGKTYHHLERGDRIKLTDAQAVPLLIDKLIERRSDNG